MPADGPFHPRVSGVILLSEEAVPESANVNPLESAPLVESGSASEDMDVQLARGGDGAAFRRIIERRQADIARMMWRFSRDRARHAELVQDVFVEAYLGLNGFRGQAPFLHWLRKIAVRVGYAHWRRMEREKHVSLEEAQPVSVDSGEQDAREAAEQVHAALAKLPPRDRLVLTLLHLEERSIADIAEMTGWSRAMVKVQAWRARNKLKKLLEGSRP